MENTNENSAQTSADTSKETQEVLIVATKLKHYIRDKSGMNTSGAVIQVLSEKIRQLCDLAMENAKKEGRKTVMDRDFG